MKVVLWWFTHILSAGVSGTRSFVCQNDHRNTGAIWPSPNFDHFETSLIESQDLSIVTKHCLFSWSSPLNFLWSAALSPALCSTGSKWLFLCKSLILVNKSCLCLLVLPINVHHLWHAFLFLYWAEMLCAVQVFTVLLLCEWQQVRCTEKTPWQKSLALCV